MSIPFSKFGNSSSSLITPILKEQDEIIEEPLTFRYCGKNNDIGHCTILPINKYSTRPSAVVNENKEMIIDDSFFKNLILAPYKLEGFIPASGIGLAKNHTPKFVQVITKPPSILPILKKNRIENKKEDSSINSIFRIIDISNTTSDNYALAEYNSSLLYLNNHLEGTADYARLNFLKTKNGVVLFLPKGTPLRNIHYLNKKKKSSLNSQTKTYQTNLSEHEDLSSFYTEASEAESNISSNQPIFNFIFSCCSSRKRRESIQDISDFECISTASIYSETSSSEFLHY